jgi:uncharacterized membrane protein YgcG
MSSAAHPDQPNSPRRSRAAARVALCAGLVAAVALPASAGFQATQTSMETTERDVACNVATPVMAEFATLAPEASLEDHEGAVLFAIGQLACGNDAIIAGLEEMLLGDNLTKLQRQAIENVLASLRAGRGRGSGAIGGARGGSFFTAPVISGGGGSSNYAS